MAEQGSKGSKGPSHVVPGKDGNVAQTTTESHGGSNPKVVKPAGHGGTTPGAH
jgi:hypothetical protein